MRPVFLDTSFVIALGNADDPLNVRAEEVDRELTRRRVKYVLHWGILFEIGDGFSRLSRRTKGSLILTEFTQRRKFQLRAIDDSLMTASLALFHARPDKEWGLTDCVSFALMEREGIKEALTADPHFRQAGFVPLLLEPA